MREAAPRVFEPFSDLQLQEMENAQKSLKHLERRDWWLWWTAVTVMLLLTLALIAVSLPSLLRQSEEAFQLNMNLAIHALVGLVLLFNLYAVYQQWMIKKMRVQTAKHLELLSTLKIRAEEFHRLATRDPLTGLSNRRIGEERLAGEVARSERYGHPLSVLMLDLNHFKEINDQHGHAAGDLALQKFAERLSKAIRTSDVAVRLGGDEFLVILPECPPERIPGPLERLGALTVKHQGKEIRITGAAGWAGYVMGETPEQLMERADQALYESKRSGAEKEPTPSVRFAQ